MVYVLLKDKGGQVVKGIKLKDPSGKHWEVINTQRKGINRYSIDLISPDGSTMTLWNHEIKTWTFNGPLKEFANDPDANLPRPERKSFWRMKSKPGSINYKQKQRLIKLPKYYKFKDDWENNLKYLEKNC